jgi:hypothetical protein
VKYALLNATAYNFFTTPSDILSNINKIVAKLKVLAETLDRKAIRDELINGFGWSSTLTKVIGKKSVTVNLEPYRDSEFAELEVNWSFVDRSAKYVYKPGEDPEDIARNIDTLAKTIVSENNDDRKSRKEKEKAELSQSRIDKKEHEKQKAEREKKRPQHDRQKVHTVKSGLVSAGWQYSKIFGYYTVIDHHKVWTTFNKESVVVSTDAFTKAELNFEELDAAEATKRIVEIANKLVALLGEDKNQPSYREKTLVAALQSTDWKNVQANDSIVRAQKETRGTELNGVITVTFDIHSGRTNFAWQAEGQQPTQILSWQIDLPANTKTIAEKINILFESVHRRVRMMDEVLARQLAEEKAKQKEDVEYQKWKAKQLKTLNKKDQEEAWKLRLEHEQGLQGH